MLTYCFESSSGYDIPRKHIKVSNKLIVLLTWRPGNSYHTESPFNRCTHWHKSFCQGFQVNTHRESLRMLQVVIDTVSQATPNSSGLGQLRVTLLDYKAPRQGSCKRLVSSTKRYLRSQLLLNSCHLQKMLLVWASSLFFFYSKIKPHAKQVVVLHNGHSSWPCIISWVKNQQSRKFISDSSWRRWDQEQETVGTAVSTGGQSWSSSLVPTLVLTSCLSTLCMHFTYTPILCRESQQKRKQQSSVSSGQCRWPDAQGESQH